MILQSQDDFDTVAEVDRNSGEYRFFSKKEHPEATAGSISGGCSVVNGTMVCLYRTEGVLYLRVGHQELELTDDVTSTIAQEDNYRVFQLRRNGNLLVNSKYPFVSREVPQELDPTPFIEDEDFDFFLFVHNVLEQTGRRQRVYSQ